MTPAMPHKPNGRDSGFNQALPANARPRLIAAIDPADWDALFDAVVIRLRHSVAEHLANPPDVPTHSAALNVNLIQAVVLDCVSALDQLHAALKQERRQRPTP